MLKAAFFLMNTALLYMNPREKALPAFGRVPVGANPLRIAIQPMYSLAQISKGIRTGLEYAAPLDSGDTVWGAVLKRSGLKKAICLMRKNGIKEQGGRSLLFAVV
jgi:hypothetical protein